MPNHRRHSNAVPVAPLARTIAILAVIGAVGLCYLTMKHQIHATGDQIKALEREIADLRTKNEVARSRVTQHASRAVLQHKLDEGVIKMVPIASTSIVRLCKSRGVPFEDAIRAVANRHTRP